MFVVVLVGVLCWLLLVANHQPTTVSVVIVVIAVSTAITAIDSKPQAKTKARKLIQEQAAALVCMAMTNKHLISMGATEHVVVYIIRTHGQIQTKT